MGRVRYSASLGLRLGLTIAFGILITALLATTGVVWRAVEREIEERSIEIRATAQVLATSLSAAAAAGERVGVQRELRVIAHSPHISFAEVRSIDGRRLSAVGQQAALVGDRGQVSFGTRLHRLMEPEALIVDVDIRHHGATVGTLRLGGVAPGLRSALTEELENSALWAAIAILIGLGIAYRLQGRILRPISRLAEVMSGVSRQGPLPSQVTVQGVGEVRVLVDSYNNMIDQITERNRVISDHRNHLERTVDQRTRELRAARDQAEQAAAAKSRFLATMSHEIRSPMNGVLVMAELLARSDLRSDQRGYARVIARSGQALLDLLNDILDLSKLDAGQTTLESIPSSIDTLVYDVQMLFWEQARAKDLALIASVDPDVPAEILCDPTRLRQCLTNLVGNALKFTEHGHVSISVGVEAWRGEADCTLKIEVSDSGTGIPEDRRQAIFAAFEQGDQSTTRKYGGTGLGLAIVSRFVECMGGQIGVDSEVGSGSCFTLRIPAAITQSSTAVRHDHPLRAAVLKGAQPGMDAALVQALRVRRVEASLADRAEETGVDAIFAAPDSVETDTCSVPVIGLWPLGTPEPRAELERGTIRDVLPVPHTRGMLDDMLSRIASGTFRGVNALESIDEGSAFDKVSYAHLRVLGADDSAVNRQVLEDALAPFGIVPHIVEHGGEALDRAQDTAFDLILLDGNMPVMDGFETARRIRALEAEVARDPARIVLVSASDRVGEANLWREAGFDEALAKPFKLSALEALLAACAGAETTRIESDESKPSAGAGEALDPATLATLNALDAKRPGARARVLSRFLDALPAALSELEMSMRSGDAERVRRAAHGLKSMSGSAGAARLAEAAADIEMAAMEAATAGKEWAEGTTAIQPVTAASHDARTAIEDLVQDSTDSDGQIQEAG